MSSGDSTIDVASWLSRVESTTSPDPSSPSIHRKRKRHRTDTSPGNKHLRLRQATCRSVVLPSRRHTMDPQTNRVTVSPEKRPYGQAPGGTLTPDTSPQKASSRTRSSASRPKLANNVHNVRRSLQDNGLYYQDQVYREKFMDFKQRMEGIVFRKRESSMKPDSVERITHERVKNATTGEDSYFRKLKPLIFKPERLVDSKKRNFAEEIVYRSKAWADDGLDDRSDVPFVRGILFQGLQSTEAQLGLMNPKPDFTFGLEDPANPPRAAPRLSCADLALIKIAESLRHPFFVIENKSAQDPIEEAENQAIRSGAALVEARRQLESKARSTDETEKEGIDTTSFAFSCCWVPQYANIFVHWHELRRDEPLDNPFDTPLDGGETLPPSDSYSSVWHMNLIQGYAFHRDEDMKEFRRDIDNILDWGVSLERKEALRVLELKLAARANAMQRALTG